MKSKILIIILLAFIAPHTPTMASAPSAEVVSGDTNYGVDTNHNVLGKDRHVRRQVRNSQKPYTKASKRTARAIRRHTRKGGRR